MFSLFCEAYFYGFIYGLFVSDVPIMWQTLKFFQAPAILILYKIQITAKKQTVFKEKKGVTGHKFTGKDSCRHQ
jgi:hypothetical protein